MVELQALERVHRLGQTRDVVITRYIMRDSFENVRPLPKPHLRY
jgi:SWI/SNF-related matrix-associated actin-dependent regulator of chromatin subfamily A3